MQHLLTRTLMLGFCFSIFTVELHAAGLSCLAGLQPDKSKNSFTSQLRPEDFVTTDTSLTQYGQTYVVRKYRAEVSHFVIEGILFLDSGVAPELSITDVTTGVVAEIKEHSQLRLSLSSPRSSGVVNISATCMKQ